MLFEGNSIVKDFDSIVLLRVGVLDHLQTGRNVVVIVMILILCSSVGERIIK
jgi:hypothetical protein